MTSAKLLVGARRKRLDHVRGQKIVYLARHASDVAAPEPRSTVVTHALIGARLVALAGAQERLVSLAVR